MIKKLEIKNGVEKLNLKTKILIFLILFLLFEYLNYKFWTNYTIQTPIIIKFQSPIIKRNEGYPYRQPTKNRRKRQNLGKFWHPNIGLRTDKSFDLNLRRFIFTLAKILPLMPLQWQKAG